MVKFEAKALFSVSSWSWIELINGWLDVKARHENSMNY
jgi:hypothetical protein